MQQVIWKFPIEVTATQTLELPMGAEILCVQTQHETPCMWVLVAPEAEKKKRIIDTFGTGHPISYNPDIIRRYIGSYQLEGGNFVGHIFERL